MYIPWDGDILKKLSLKTWNKGSYSVEASLLLPFIFFVLLYFIYFTFYLHDKEVMTNVAYEIALTGSSGGIIEEATMRKYSKGELLAYGESRINGTLLSTKIKNIVVENRERETKVSIVGEFLNPLSDGLGIPILIKDEINIVQMVKAQNSPDYVRKGQVLIEGIKELWK